MVELHTEALKTVSELGSTKLPRWAKPIDDYESDLKLSRGDFGDRARVRTSLLSAIEPLMSIAERSGFTGGWRWSPRELL